MPSSFVNHLTNVKILVVEDDHTIAEILHDALVNQRYLVEVAKDGLTGWEMASTFAYDLILLDVMLPGLDGISLCRQLRQTGDLDHPTPNLQTPVLLLTAQDTSFNKVAGLDAGADDYMVKPFDLSELMARIRALLRRGTMATPPVLTWGRLQLDPTACQLTWDGHLVHLTSKEYEVLELFLRNPHRIFSQSALIEHLWEAEETPTENAVRAHIKAVRQKLKRVGAEDPIETVYRLGYRLRQNPAQPEPAPIADLEAASQDEPISLPDREPPPLLTEQFQQIWERNRHQYDLRLQEIEAAIAATHAGILPPSLRQSAQKQAHTLIGSLGSFGFREASRLCRQIEQRLKGTLPIPLAEAAEMANWLHTLRQEILQPLPLPDVAVSAPISPLNGQPIRLLIVDDDALLAAQLQATAIAQGMQAICATDLHQAREMIARDRPDVILLDLSFPDTAESGLELLAELIERDASLPVIVFTAQEKLRDRIQVARLGAKCFLQKPIAPAQVMQTVIEIVQRTRQTETKLLAVEEDPQILEQLQQILTPWGFQLTMLHSPQQFLETLEQLQPDLLILDVEFYQPIRSPGMGELACLSGIDLCQVVRNDPRWEDLPILVLSARTDAEIVQQVFLAGADDYISKPIVEPELVARVLSRLERAKMVHKSHPDHPLHQPSK